MGTIHQMKDLLQRLLIRNSERLAGPSKVRGSGIILALAPRSKEACPPLALEEGP